MTRPHLVVFFTRGMSLEAWHRAGILEREIALYRRLLSNPVERLAFLTYGGPEDLKWTSLLPGLEILPNRWGITPNLYSVLAPWLHRKALRKATVFKTNQINGAWCAVIAQMFFRKVLIVRSGYLWGDFVAHLGASRLRQTLTRLVERVIMRRADRVVVATPADSRVVADRYGIEAQRITVIPNYVDTERFRPLPDTMPEPGRIAFVGRLEHQKNVESLIDAMRGLEGLRLTIVGDGSLRAAFEKRARELGVAVEFLGRIPHARLPAVLHRAEVFVLPSHYEGTPKALLEAMACGVPVIGARSPGIREILTHGETGFLCGTSADEIRAALLEVLGDAGLRVRLREGGTQYVRQHCSLDLAVERERVLLTSIAEAA